MEPDIDLSYSFCELENQYDCVFGTPSFSLPSHVFSHSETIGFNQNHLRTSSGTYESDKLVSSVDFINKYDCSDLYFSFSMLLPKLDVSVNADMNAILSGASKTMDINGYLRDGGKKGKGYTRVTTNTSSNDFQQYINFSSASLVSTTPYVRDEETILPYSHITYVWEADVEAKLVFQLQKYNFAIGFSRTFLFYLRELDCGGTS